MITLEAYYDHIVVYPGMQMVLHSKEYVVQHAVLSLGKDEITVVVKRRLPETT